MENKIHELYALERLSGGDTVIHRLHPAVKLLSAIVFIITVVSLSSLDTGGLLPFVFYPFLLSALSETPHSLLFKRLLLALPFCLFAGLSNAIIDRAPAFRLGTLTVSCGVVSLFGILIKTYLCVMAVLLLVATTPFSELSSVMRRFGVPYIFTAMFEMTYRYIGVLLYEAHSMYAAYSLRSGGGKGVRIKDMGSFVGHFLLRGFDRAERVYNAMKCRGYALDNRPRSKRGITVSDIIYLAAICALCVIFRFADINGWAFCLTGGLF